MENKDISSWFEEEYARITYDSQHHLLILTWITPPLSREFRFTMNAAAAAMQHFGTGKLITDINGIGAMLEEDQRWSATDWFPRAIAAGYSAIAVVNRDDNFSGISVEGAINRVGDRSKVQTRYFATFEEALAWIK
ncbi:MAG TPA: hypothetical protein VIN08_04230 [Ohtaekwangia sp.]|uniref:hypothetical protein n=1 Tax=Ohtaekwangia sp. TaxID=2066019 RepID=UPI002F9447B3